MKVNSINDPLDQNYSFSQINQRNLIKKPLKDISHNSESSELTKTQVHDRVDVLGVNSYQEINYKKNNQSTLSISVNENLLKISLDKIHHKMRQGEVLIKEDFGSLSQVLLSQDFDLNIRKESVTLVHKYINTQKKLPKIFLDLLEKAEININDPLKKDVDLILTRALLINQQLTKPSSKVNGLFEKRGNLIVTRENVAVKRTNNFRSNILDLNLDKKATVQKGKEVTISKKVNSQKLPELPDNGNHTKWHRSSLAEVQNYLCLARINGKLTKEDFDYLFTCLYSNNKEHQIARADPGIFEILKHTTCNRQQLPKKFIPVIENILTDKILNTSENRLSNGIKETFNIYTLSLGNRYALSNCENQGDIAWYIGKVAPSILCNLAEQAQILEPSTLDSMHYSLSNKKDEHGLILYTFGIASRNQDLKERFEKITPLIKIYDSVLPIVTSAAIEALTRYSVDISKNALNFLEKALEKFDKNNAIFFFGKKDTRESSSWEKRYSWRDSHYEAVNKFFNISNKGEDLTLGELKYLKDHIKQDYVGNKDLMKSYTALIILKKVTYNGQKLPPETINVLEKLVTTKDIDTKKQITFILGCVLRNGQNVALSAISEMEKVFDLGRKSSAYALGYHVEKYGTDRLPSTAMSNLKSILSKTPQDKEMRGAISFALNTIIQKSTKASITDLEDELLKNPELTSAFLGAVLKKEILSSKAIINLGKICSDRNIEIEIRRNASLTLSCAAENVIQIFPENILENFVEISLKNKDIDICNNVASFLGYQASKNIEILATKHNVIKYLGESILNTEISINASFTLQRIAENMYKVHRSTLKNFNILFEASGKVLVDNKSHTETKCNIALSLAHAAKNGYKFAENTIANITDSLSESDNQDINKPLLSALGYSAQYPELFNEASLSKVIFALNSDKKDVSDSARAVLEKILTNKSYKLVS